MGTQKEVLMAQGEFNEKDLTETQEAVEEKPAKKKIEYDESLFENSTIFGSSTVTVKKRKLSPLKKGLLLSGIAIVLAAAILVVTLVIPEAQDTTQASSAASTPTYTVTSFAEAKVNKVTVYNSNHPDGYAIYKVENEASSSSAATSSGASSNTVNYAWKVEGYEKYDLSSAQYLVKAVIAITSSKKYDNLASTKADDYEIGDFSFNATASVSASSATESVSEANIYGFDTPYSVINIDAENGSLMVIVGNTAPDGSGRYVTVSGDDSIYVVSESEIVYVGSDLKDLVGLLAVSYMLQDESNAGYYSEGALVKIDSIELGGTCRPKKITVESPPDELSAISYVVSSPVFRAANETSVNNILSVATSGLSNDGAYVLGYTDADLKKYGLDNPYSTVNINIGTYKVALKFGAPIEQKNADGTFSKYYPCIVNDKDIIYRIAVPEGTEDNPDWISYKDTDVYYESLFLEYITGISSINMAFADKQATFNLTHSTTDNGSKTFTVDSPEANEGVTIEKKQLSYLYGRILNLSAESISNDPVPNIEPYLTITIKYTDKSKQTDVIRLYKATTRRYFYTLNGQGNALVAANRVEDLYARMNDLLSGVEIKRGN